MTLSSWGRFKLRLTACYRILSRKQDHWVLFSLTDEQLKEMLEMQFIHRTGKVKMQMLYHGLQKFNVESLIKFLDNSKPFEEFVLDQAAYEAKAELQ